jgi:hypothetical protein
VRDCGGCGCCQEKADCAPLKPGRSPTVRSKSRAKENSGDADIDWGDRSQRGAAKQVWIVRRDDHDHRADQWGAGGACTPEDYSRD